MKNISMVSITVALLLEASQPTARAVVADAENKAHRQLLDQYLKAFNVTKPFETKLAVHCYSNATGV